jgi:choline-sulfatase
MKWLAATLAVVVCLVGILAYFRGVFRASRSESRASAAPGRIRGSDYAPVHGPRFARANVVVISIDTLRRDHVAPYGAPFETIAASRLAREGALFEHAVSQVPLTLPSHTSLFTGLYPPHHAVRDNGGFVLGMNATTLAERFLANGYSTAGFVSSYVLDSRWGIGQGHETYDDSLDYEGLERRSLTDVERPAESVVDAALGWLRQPKRGERPFYLWVHLYDPHEPYAPPDEYRRRAPTAYAGEVIYADAQVARLLGALDALNLRGNTVIVYLSDHGESLGEHGEPTHGIFLYGSTLDVPLIIAPPTGRPTGLPPLTLAGRRVRGLARLVDITPTLLDLAELPVPPGLDGVSLLPMVAHEVSAGAGSPPGSDAAREKGADTSDAIVGPVSYAESHFPRLHYGWSELVALETERWKFVRAPRSELYDLREDPTELHDVSSRYPRVAATLQAQLDTMKLLEANDEPTSATIDADSLARLRSLGYISGRESEASRRKGPRPDPKDQMPLLQELLQAQALGDAGQLDDAARRLEALARRDPDNPAVHLALSSVYLARKDAQAAVASARHAVELDPDSAVAVLNLAFAYQAAGRVDAAASGFERVLALDPDNLKALVSLGEIHYGRGEREKALDLYQRAATVAPGFAPVQVSLGVLALELNRRQVAEIALKRAAAMGGTPPPGLHFNLGVLAEQRGDAAAAAREYRAEVTAYPESLEAWVNLGLLERQAGNADAAVAAFEHAATAKTDAFVGPYLLAETLSRLGRGADAERWAREALRRNPNEPRVHQLLQRMQKAGARK